MAKPESIEALLSPSLRVSRPVAACARCRSAKIKCDGKLPACSACERSGKADSCTASNDEFARGKERSYVAALEAATERLQRRIEERRVNPSAGLPVSPIRTVSGGRRKEMSVVDELVGDLGFLSVNATARDFHGFTSTMSFARLLLSASKAADLPRYGPSPPPPRYATSAQLQYYLENIFVLLPFLSETELMTSVSRVYDQGRAAPALDHWCLRMTLAISAAASSQTRGDANHEIALRHVGAALERAEEVLHPGSISGLQAILLLVLYSLVDPEHFRSWYLIGMASRIMVDLGIHVEPSPDLKVAKHTLDLRRRIFYCVFALDRAISISLGRAFSFTDDSAPEVQLPADTDKENASQIFLQSIRPSSYLFDIRRVQSVFYQATRSSTRTEWSPVYATDYMESVLRDVESWQATVPATLSLRHSLYFRLERLYTRILILSPSIRLPLHKLSESNKIQLFELTFQYIDQLQPVTQDITWHAFFTFTDILRGNFIGRQFIDLVQLNFDQLLCSGLLSSPRDQSQGPSLASPTPLDNCVRSIDCIQKIVDILDFARLRWALGTLRTKFETESAVLMGKLRNRQQELSNLHSLTTGNGTNQHQSPHMPEGRPIQDPYTFDDQHFIDSTSPYHDQPEGTQAPFQSTSPLGASDQSRLPLPSGSLLRRSYEFLGGRGS